MSAPRPAAAPRLAALALAAPLALAPLPAAGQSPADSPSVSGSAAALFSAWEDRGSALAPAGASGAHSGAARLELRAEAGGLSRCAFEGTLSVDAASGEASFEVRELWAEWRPGEALSLRAGRQRFGFGAGFGWNPSNDLDPQRYATDPSAPRSGADAALLRLEAGGLVGFPLSLSLVGALPAPGPGVALAEGRAGAWIYALAGELELMLVGSVSGLGGADESWLAGGWATLPLGPAVLGLEGSARKRSDLPRPDAAGAAVRDGEVRGAAVATATLRSGDFVLVAEAAWNGAAYTRGELDRILASPALPAFAGALLAPGSVGAWHGLARLAWASGDHSAALGIVADLETGAFVASAKAEEAIQGRATLGLEAALPAGTDLLERDELGLAGRGWTLRATLAVHF